MRNTISTLLVLTGLLLTDSGRAATVTTTADDGPGSLRDAIANATPGETINFSTSGTITLTSGELSIDKDLIISGPGASNLVIQRSTESGTPNFRIFDVLSGNVTLSGLTVSNGRDDVSGGGGINNQSDLTLNDCVVVGNSATESGGGIFNTSTMIASNCVVRGNSAAGQTWDGFGGGIYNSGTLTIINGTIRSNSITSGAAGAYGGGICNDGTLTVLRSVIKDNSATGWQDGGGGFGAGLYDGFGTAYLYESTLSGNVARGGGAGLGEGGGVGNYIGTTELNRCTVSGNSAVGGDGGAPGEGGGIANDFGTVYVESSTVSGNISSGAAGTVGGGLFNDSGSLVLSYSTVTANVVPGGLPDDGAGIFNLWGSVEYKSSIIAANLGTVDFYNGEFGFLVSYGYNLMGSTSGYFPLEAGDQFVSAAALKLGPLQDNGGPTFTHALLCGSVAIDAGNNAGAPDTDQRGFARIVHDVIDIGAYETGNNVPTINCPSPITLNCAPPEGMVATVSVNVADADGDPLVVVWTVDGTAYQTNLVAAGGPPTDSAVGLTNLFGIGSHELTVSVSDSSGCLATCSTTVEVVAIVPPTVSCPPASSASADATCQAAVPNVLTNVTVNAACASGEMTLTQSPAAGTLLGLGTHTITVTATDDDNNSVECTTTFTVTDNTPPTVSCPPASSASADANCQAAVPSVSASVSDNCSAPGAITLTQSPAAGTQVGLGAHTITVTATDAAGNSASCATTFTVTDNTPPTVSCPPASSASADANCQAAVPSVSASVSDNCSAPGAITLIQSPAAGTQVGLGAHTITVTATDAAGNSANCTTTFTVTDNTPPTVSCPPASSASADANCQAAVPSVSASVSDNCSAPGAITLTQSPAAGTQVGLGAHTITVTATDAAGNSASCTTTFTVTDNTPPTVSCPPASSASADANCQAAVPSVSASVSDNCSAASAITITQSPAAGTLVGVGTHSITVTATDAAGNSAECTTTFTVTDNTPPTVSCPPASSASADANCQAAVPNVLAGVSVSDTCSALDAITLTQSPAAGTQVGLGAHTITVTATDAAGNSASCTTIFTVTDNTPPTVSCPPASSASADANCQAAVPSVSASVSDNCSAASAITITQSPAAGTLVGVGTHSITVTATDAAGNSAECTTTFTVTDTTAPTIVCPALPGASADANCQAAVPSVSATVSDNCSAVSAITIAQSPAAGTLVGLGTHSITVTATDAAGNSAECTTTFTVADTTAPTVVCPALPGASADANCQAAVPSVQASVSDNCSAASAITITQSPAAGTLVGVGTHSITVTATDAAGNESTCTASFTVTDTTAPTVVCSAVPGASADANCQAPVPTVPASATDNCTAAGAISITQSPAAGTLVGAGTHSITVTATDAAGNSASCTTTFTVTDTTAPTVTCPADSSATADANCQAAVPDLLGGVMATDNCTASEAILLSQSPAAGTLVALGTNTITITATDAAGNSATCTTLFTVTGNATPTVVCPDATSASADANCQAAVPNVLGGVTLSGGCNGTNGFTLSQSPAAGTLVGLGAHTITVTATDATGNSATCATSFTVTDTTAPTVNCPADSSASADANCQAPVPNVAASASDNCTAADAITITQSPAAGTLVGLGTHTITVTATDAAGNSATCTTSFAVTDTTAPTVVCPAVPSVSADGNCQAAVPSVAASVNDNCSAAGAISITQSPAAGILVGLGTHMITVTATDAAGNSASCTTSFTVTDTTAPTVVCPAMPSASADANCQAAVPTVAASVSDNCSAAGAITISQSPAAGTLVGLGMHTITVTATDAAGNSASCTTSFTVTDTTAPTVVCPTVPDASADANCQAPVPTVAASASDNCSAAGAITITQSPAAGTLVGLGMHTITVTATDAAGNSASCTTSFMVTDNTPPSVVCPTVPDASANANCQAAVPTVAASVSDNCTAADAITITQSPAAGTLVGLGTNTITITATDAAGNSATCTTTFTVTGNATLTVACPAATSASADANCQAAVPNVLGGATLSGGCNGTNGVTLSQSPAAGTLVGLGPHTITVTATDATGNTATCTTTFTVTDDTAPSVICPTLPSASANANCQAAVPTVAATVSDNCTAANAMTLTQSPTAGTLVGLGTHTITVTATDAAGNSASCTTTFTVIDNTAPTVSCPAATSTSAGANCQAAVPNVLSGVTASDNCSAATLTQSPTAGTMVGLGAHTITVTATDAAGNSASCTTSFTVIDNTPPTVSCPADTSASASANCQAAVPTVAATVSDNCTAANAITLTQSPTAGTLVGLGPHTITVTATDATGNSSSCTTTFTVIDNTPPTVVCPAPTSSDMGTNCQAAIPSILSGVTVSDNCSAPNAITLTQSPVAGTLVGSGPHTITVTATDAAGNNTTCTTTFTVTGSGAAIHIIKLTNGTDNDSPTGPHVLVDSVVTWTYLVTNPGCEPLQNVSVTDSVAGVIPAFQSGDANLNGLLEPGETWTYSASGKAIYCQYENIGTATGTGTVSGTSVTSSNPDHYFGDPTPCPSGSFFYNIDPATGDLLIKFYQFPAPNDNSYGVNAVGWPLPRGHTFKDQVNSDHAGFQLRNPNGQVKLDFWVDYMTEDPGSTPSGYRSLGPFGGDGRVVTGTLTPNDIVCDTSLARNLNNLGYFVNGVQTAATKNGTNGADLLLDSPPTLDTISNYTLKTPNPWTNGWDFADSYFVTIKKAKLDSLGFDIATWHVEADTVGLHNSPAKPCPTGPPPCDATVSTQVTPATGGDAIPADGAVSGVFTTLTGPIYTEVAAAGVTTGTIILNAPAGFVFDTGGTAPSVATVKSGGGSGNLIQGSVTSRTSTQITYTVTSVSTVATKLTWQNVRVRPTSGTPLLDSYLTRSGTATLPGAPAGISFGDLTEIAGVASRLAMLQQPSTTAMAGVAFDQQPSVAILDQFGNVRSVANGVVDSPTSTEERSVVTAVRLAGSGNLQGSTSVAAADGLVGFTNLFHNVATNITIQFTLAGVTPVTSDPITITVGSLSRLGFATQPGNAAAGSPFGTQPVIQSQDAFGNPTTVGLPASLPVTVSLTSGTGPLQGTTTVDIGTSAGNGIAVFSNLRIDSGGTGKQLTASATGLTSGVSAAFTVNQGPIASLAIQTQPPATATAGIAFSPAPKVWILDAFGNLATTDNSTVITATRSLGTASLQGTTTATAVNGVATFSNLSYNKAEVITIAFSSGSLTGATSTSVTIGSGAASKLTIQTQPSTATAGAAFAPQPVIRVEDASGNLVTTDNGRTITVARSAGTGTLQGTLTATTVNGIATFANLSHNVANTITLNFTASGLTSVTSGNVLVGSASFAKLQLLVPGETAAPGTASGKTGTPSAQTESTGIDVTVNAVDAYWNLANTATDMVRITSSDASATLPPNQALVSGTATMTVFLNATGNFTVTASDLTDGSKSPSTSPAISVGAAQFTPATGGEALPADGATGTFTSLTGPTYTENNPGEVRTGTIILSAPAGFVFDTGGTTPTVSVVKAGGSGSPLVQGSVTSVTTNRITFTVTGTSAVRSLLTWQNIRVRPTSGTTLASGYISRSGTATVTGLGTNVNLGTLGEVAGAPANLVIITQPSSTAAAGVAFAQQPVLEVRDQFGNLRNAANGITQGDLVTATRLAGSGSLQGTTGMTSTNGIATFANLSHNVANTITIQFSSGSATATSIPIAVSAGMASKLVFTMQPGNGTAGSALAVQPAVQAQDAFGNYATTGLPASLPLGLSLSSGTGTISGTSTLDIGTAAGNGTATFANLRIDTAGTGKQLTASAAGLSNAVSIAFTVNPGAATSLAIQTQPPTTATAGATFSPASVVRILDSFGNVVTTDSSTVITAARSLGTAALQGTTSATAVSGVATFSNLSYTKAETITIGFSSGSLTGATSSNVTVNPAAANKLTIQTQPSATATAGVAFAQQSVVRIEDTYGNLRSSDNSTVVTVARSAGSGTLQGTLTATAVNGVATFANLSHNVANTITLSFTATGLTSATSSNVLVSSAAFAKLQLLVPGETAAPGTASGKTGTPTASTAATAFNITVNAVDSFWNVVNSVTDTVDISSTDANGSLPANAALVAGTKTLSVTLKTAGSQTLTATDVTDASKSANTSPSMTVNAGAFVKMQLLVPGETAAPGTATGKTGTATAQTAGTAFNVTVNAVDANWNLVSSTHTVGITTTDANDTHPANAAMTAGTKTFAVTFKSAGSWTITASDITDGTKTANTSPAITANVGAFAKLQILVPGETTAPGSSTGKTGAPTAQAAGTPFNVIVNAVDANWNPITTVTDTVGITSSDANAILPATSALIAGTQSFSVTLRTTGSSTLTAADLSDGTKTANTSSSIPVNAGPFAKMQVVVPGETAAPGTASGKTGTPTAQTAGTAFNVTIRSVDAAWNLVTNSTHTVGLTSSDSAAVLPANGALASGTRTVSVTLKTTGSQTVTGSDITDGTKTANTSPAITVNAGAASKLTIQTQPSTTATAGAAFAQQPVIRIEDAYGNLRSSDNSTVVTVSRSAGSGTLQGTVTATAVNGVATFANLSHNLANTITLSFTASGLTSTTSGNVVVSAAAFAKLQLLVPGETAAPATTNGKTGTPTAQTAATAFNITVNAVDSFWNVVNTVTDTVDLSSTDSNATLPADAALVSGTKTLIVTFKTAGSRTLTASDVTDGSKSANTSPSITVNAGAFTKLQLLVPGETAAPGSATGKTGTPTAQSAGTAFNVTANAVDANWNIASSTDTVGITTTDANDTHPANTALSAGTRTFAVTFKTVGSWTITTTDITDATKTAYTSPSITANVGVFTKLQILLPGETAAAGSATGKTGTRTAQTAGTPFNVTVNAVDANWNPVTTVTDTVGITSSDANAVLPANAALVVGTQSFSVTLKTAGSRTVTASDITDGTKTANTSPSITVNAGAFVKMQVLVPGETAAPGTASGKTGTPSATTSGTAFNVTMNAVDANWNVASSTHTVGITSSDSSATLPANGALVAGTRTASVTLNAVGTHTVTATDITDGTKTANTSPAITVNVGPASKLTIQTQPSATAAAGVVLAQQPVIRIEDANGNLRTSDNSTVVTVARSAGSGTLQGTLTATAVNGIATFTDLSHNVANTITLNFTATGLTNATSGNIVVSPAAFAKLQLLVPGETAAPGSASGKTGTPTASTAATAFNVTVNAVDSFWNVVNTATDTVGITSTDANATLPANAALVSGTKTLSVTLKTAGSQTLTATDVTNSSKTANTSPAITVNAGAFVKLQLLVPGETAAPGSATGKTGTPTAQSSGAAFNVTVNAVDANWNIVSSTHTVSITTTDANDIEPANAALTAGTRTFAVTMKSVGSWTIAASDITDGTKTANTSPAITVNVGAFAKMQILLPGETAAPGSATGKTGTPTAQTSGTPFNVTVNAVDANWNPVTTVTDTVGVTTSDVNDTHPANAALVAGTQSFSITLRTAGTSTVTASDITDATKTANTSPSVTINAGVFVKLQLLVPGETAAPGTATGKTGTPSALASGTAYNVTIRSVDANWNLVSSTHTVGITSTDSSATLPANGALAAGTRTASVTLRTLGSQTVTATDITDGTKTANTSPAITVNVGSANKLTIQTQPSSSATAGDAFAQQPVIRVEDANGNLVTSDNGRVITAARSAGTGTLQGTLTATTVNGIATFANLSHNVANTITLSFTAGGLTSATSGNIVISPDTATQLLFTTQPASLRTGSPLATQPVVKAVDQFGNATSVGLPANFNVSLALTSGSGSLLGTTALDIGSAAGNGTATFTNVECSDAGTNKQITASAAGFANVTSSMFTLYGVERATGGTAIPSSGAGGTYTTLTGPTYWEGATADVGTGTIILNPPSGFIFDTGGTAPTVLITRTSVGSDSHNINGVSTGTSAAITSRTTTQITFTITSSTSSAATNSLKWQNVRVRPVASSPLASGNITKTGTSSMAAVTNSSTSFGRLIEIGPASRLVVQTQPSTTGTAGVVFAQQPLIRAEDSAGNLVATNGLVITAARGTGTGTLQGALTATTVNGIATFTNLSYNVAETMTISFSAPGTSGTNSSSIVVSPAAADRLAFATQPANGTNGFALATQPVLRSRDQFGNDSTIGLGANKDVTVSLSAGTGPLMGTTTLDIGTSAGNGVISFTDLRIDSAGSNKQLTASATGLSSATSSVFTVAKANQTISFGALAGRTYGEAPFTVGASASSALPVSFSIVSGPATISGNTVTITGAGTVTVRASQSGDANWNAATSVDQSFAVAKLTVTGNITASSKVYDGTTAATIATRTLSGVIGADNVSLSGGTATFANKNVGNGKTVTATGLSLSGTAAGNYQLASASATTSADITAKGLTVSGVTANNKVYDNTTTATLNFGSAALVGVVSGDAVTLNTSSAAGAFADENVGTAKSVTVSGLSLSGADAANYTLTQPATTASITTHGLTVTGITADNKVYDGTNTATLNLGGATLVGVASGDTVTLETGSATATFADANVGTAKTVTVSGLSLSGADAANYALVQPSATANITAATVTGSITADNKTYDGTTAATIATRTISGVIGSDNVSLSGGTATFADKNVGSGKTVTATGLSLSGADAGNYQLASTSATTTAAITARPLTVSATGVNKVYDATTLATVTLSDNRVSGDDLTTSYMMASFANKDVGTGKTVSVSGIVVTGTDEDNYTANTTAITTANITPATLMGSITAENKIYDGTAAATIATRTLSALEGSDDVSLVGGTATFADKNVGTGKSVTATGLSLTGPDVGNYQLASTSATTTANIASPGLTVSGVTANNKVYDGTTTATLNLGSAALVGVLSGDAVTLDTSSATGAFADENVGTAKPVTVSGLSLSGADAANYTLTQPATMASITTHGLTVTGITANNKVYDGTNAATLDLSSATLVGVASGDAVTLETNSATATFADANVGTAKAVTVSGLSLSGDDAANYALLQPSTTADITAATVTASVTVDNKIYDGTTAATIATRAISGVIGDDNVSLNGGTATFADENVGTAKSVTGTGLSLSGDDAGNYQLASTSATTTADITPRALTVSATGLNKVYDNTTMAAVTLADNRVSGDDMTASYTAASFADANVGTGKTIAVSGILLTGTDADNYAVNATAIASADITLATLTAGVTADNKIYDGTTAAALATGILNGVMGNDDVSLVAGTASFADKNVGVGKTVTATGLSLGGTAAGNYQLASTSAATSADITAATLTGSVTASSKTYDGTTAAPITSRNLSGVLGSDDVSLVAGTATFADKNVGTGKSVTATGLGLSGADAGNYQLASTSAATSADIAARSLTVSATGENKIYDGTTAATVTLSDNRVSGDDLTASYTTASYADKNVGTGKTVSVSGISVSGTDAANYTVSTTAGTTADITARALTVSAAGVNKVYDGTTAATVTLSDDRIAGDDLTVSYTTASFADNNVQNGKPVSVSGISVSGTDAGNYTANTEASTVADITGATLTVVGITAQNKVYDGTTVATLNLDGAEAIGVVSGDDVTVEASGVAGAFSDAEVGTGKLVTVSGLTLTGADAGKYMLTQPTTTADITAQ